MMNQIVILFRFLLKHKWKIVSTAFLVLIFTIMLFPFSDLNDLVSNQVSKITNNNVFVEFENMHVNPVTTTLSFEKIYLETPQISGLSSDELSVSPSLLALITKKPSGTITAKGFLNGDIEIHIKPITPENSQTEKTKLDVTANNISLHEAKQAANINLPIKGQLSLTTQALADLSLTEQPELDMNLTILKFEMASTSVPLQDFGQITLPEVKLGKIELKGRLSNGKFQIETGKFGTTQDELYGELKGELSISFQNAGGQIIPIIGSYNIMIDLKATSTFKGKAQLFLSFLDGYKASSTENLTHYKFKISANRMGSPPQFSPMN